MDQTQIPDRIKSAIGVVLLHILLGYGLVIGLGIDVARTVDERLRVFDIPGLTPPPPVEEAVPAPEKSREPAERLKARPKDPEGAAAPPNLKASPTQIVAPPPEVRLPVPPPVVAAPVAGPGNDWSAGAALRPGPGTGAGGQGTGLGSGARGSGTGGGGGSGLAVGPRKIRGEIYDSDYPRGAVPANRMETVYLRFVVRPDGRVDGCTVTRSSGNRALDNTTCSLIQRRFRYRPARDMWGRPVAAPISGEHVWVSRVEPDRWVEPTIPDDGPYYD